MNKIEVFDPAMCCPTDVCDPTVDPKLVQFAADLEWLKEKGVTVERYNLAQQPDKFAARMSVTYAMALAYHREVERTTRELPQAVHKLLPRMRDANYTKILIVTLPEVTPIQEAKQLEKDLERAGITPHAWIINQSLASFTLSDLLLQKKQHEELPHIQKLLEQNSPNVYLSGWDTTLSESIK